MQDSFVHSVGMNLLGLQNQCLQCLDQFLREWRHMGDGTWPFFAEMTANIVQRHTITCNTAITASLAIAFAK